MHPTPADKARYEELRKQIEYARIARLMNIARRKSEAKAAATRKQRAKMKRHNKHQQKMNPNWGRRS